MKTPSANANEKFLSGYNCAQAVLWSFCEGYGLDPGTAVKVKDTPNQGTGI